MYCFSRLGSFGSSHSLGLTVGFASSWSLRSLSVAIQPTLGRSSRLPCSLLELHVCSGMCLPTKPVSFLCGRLVAHFVLQIPPSAGPLRGEPSVPLFGRVCQWLAIKPILGRSSRLLCSLLELHVCRCTFLLIKPEIMGCGSASVALTASCI